MSIAGSQGHERVGARTAAKGIPMGILLPLKLVPLVNILKRFGVGLLNCIHEIRHQKGGYTAMLTH